MILAVVSHKGGVGKTTSAVHLAAYFQTLGSTFLLDGNDTRNAIKWSQRGAGFPFRVAPIQEAAQQRTAPKGGPNPGTGAKYTDPDFMQLRFTFAAKPKLQPPENGKTVGQELSELIETLLEKYLSS